MTLSIYFSSKSDVVNYLKSLLEAKSSRRKLSLQVIGNSGSPASPVLSDPAYLVANNNKVYQLNYVQVKHRLKSFLTINFEHLVCDVFSEYWSSNSKYD